MPNVSIGLSSLCLTTISFEISKLRHIDLATEHNKVYHICFRRRLCHRVRMQESRYKFPHLAVWQCLVWSLRLYQWWTLLMGLLGYLLRLVRRLVYLIQLQGLAMYYLGIRWHAVNNGSWPWQNKFGYSYFRAMTICFHPAIWSTFLVICFWLWWGGINAIGGQLQHFCCDVMLAYGCMGCKTHVIMLIVYNLHLKVAAWVNVIQLVPIFFLQMATGFWLFVWYYAYLISIFSPMGTPINYFSCAKEPSWLMPR